MIHPGETRQRQHHNCNNCCHLLSHTLRGPDTLRGLPSSILTVTLWGEKTETHRSNRVSQIVSDNAGIWTQAVRFQSKLLITLLCCLRGGKTHPGFHLRWLSKNNIIVFLLFGSHSQTRNMFVAGAVYYTSPASPSLGYSATAAVVSPLSTGGAWDEPGQPLSEEESHVNQGIGGWPSAPALWFCSCTPSYTPAKTGSLAFRLLSDPRNCIPNFLSQVKFFISYFHINCLLI